MRDAEDLRVFHSGEHICGYFHERVARDLVMDPRDPRLPFAYPTALSWGFRRSGDILYRPHCQACSACIATRICVAEFVPDRSQRRCVKRNADLEVRILPAKRNDEHFALYKRYLKARHSDGGMQEHGPVEFDQFLVGTWSDTRFMEVRRREDSRLLAVAVTDRVPDALSAVYTFYDPLETERSLGTFCVLSQIEWAKRDGRQFLYLGYWIEGHGKMDYKRRFQPSQGFYNGRWQPMRLENEGIDLK